MKSEQVLGSKMGNGYCPFLIAWVGKQAGKRIRHVCIKNEYLVERH